MRPGLFRAGRRSGGAGEAAGFDLSQASEDFGDEILPGAETSQKGSIVQRSGL
jgi:hypothetical protein